jgi:hypothetical protein
MPIKPADPMPMESLFRVSRARAHEIRGEFKDYYKYLKGFCSLRSPTGKDDYFVMSRNEIVDARKCLMQDEQYAACMRSIAPHHGLFNFEVFFQLIRNGADPDGYYLATMMLADESFRSDGAAGYMDVWNSDNFSLSIPRIKNRLDRYVFSRAQTKQNTPQKA